MQIDILINSLYTNSRLLPKHFIVIYSEYNNHIHIYTVAPIPYSFQKKCNLEIQTKSI